MANSIVYSNSRVKAKEIGFIDSEKITRMCHAENLKSAVRILMENNYGGGIMTDNPYEYEKILVSEEKNLNEFMSEILPEKSGMEVFLLKIDYHNAKAFLKAWVQNKDANQEELMSGGVNPIDRIKQGVFENTNILPIEMGNVVSALKSKHVAGGITPREIDVSLDKAFYSHCVSIASRAKDKNIKKYVKASIDIANISVFFRTKRIDDKKMFSDLFLSGGSISYDSLERVFDESYEIISDKLKFTDISALIAAACREMQSSGSLVAFERDADNYLLDIFKDNRHDIFSVLPMAGYYLAKKYEIKTLRTILICIKNNVSIELAKERLRDNYLK